MPSGSSREQLIVSTTREEAVRNAIYSLEELQQLSLLPGGFGKARRHVWPYLLGVLSSSEINASISNIEESTSHDCLSKPRIRTPDSSASTKSEHPPTYLHESSTDGPSSPNFNGGTDFSPHPDEHQVQLDTNRSFILYPIVQSPVNQKRHLQEDLHDVIMGVLRKRPALRYFQGYHDIITVLFLTLPVGLVLPTAEKLSLHRLRDSMGKGLEPLVGQLRILKRLLRMVDPPYAEILERSSPLPYYALSNLLTLFAHDVPTLSLIQHVFDWLLCREPVASIWLAAAVILSRKEDVLALEREGEEALGMIHAVLSAMPPLSEGDPSILSLNNCMDVVNAHTESERPEEKIAVLSNVAVEVGEEAPATAPSGGKTSGQASSDRTDPLTDSWLIDSPTSPPAAISVPDFKTEFDSAEMDDTTPNLGGGSDINIPEKEQSPPRTKSLSHSRSTSLSLPGEYKEKPHVAPLPLTTLLCHASDLLAAYPPSSPLLRLTETFGSHSALRTNGLAVPDLFTSLPDDVAESFVGGDSVVFPMSREEEDEESFHTKRPKNRQSDRENMRNGRPIRIIPSMVVRRQTVLAGVVLLLGVAVALYGLSPGDKSGRTGNMRYAAAWIGGLAGVGERLGVGL